VSLAAVAWIQRYDLGADLAEGRRIGEGAEATGLRSRWERTVTECGAVKKEKPRSCATVAWAIALWKGRVQNFGCKKKQD
jgi:hypothetical protein